MKTIYYFTASLLISILVVTSAAGELFYYHNDNFGTPMAITDKSGEVVWRADELPFGEEYETIENPIKNNRRFLGKELDESSGLICMGSRYLDPDTGRFTQPDPVRLVDPATGKINQEMLLNPQRQNRYVYSLNNPYRYMDPDGNFPIDTVWDIANVIYDIAVGDWVSLGADATAMMIPYVPAGSTKLLKAGKIAKGGKKVDLKEIGSYTNTHASGRTYSGKGSRLRSQQSGRRQARQHNDPHVATDFTSAKGTREAFKQESQRLDVSGGKISSSNYNKIESPGQRYRKEDGEL